MLKKCKKKKLRSFLSNGKGFRFDSTSPRNSLAFISLSR